MELAQQLYTAGLGVFPCREDKKPAIPRGTSWKDQASLPPNSHQWPTGLAGLPVPAGVVVIDLDTYKGVTREKVETLLGCELPWADALIQATQHGGEHYAFRCDWPVRQGNNLHGLRGFDTRAGDKGYICTGFPGYNAYGLGVLRLAYPAFLPVLPGPTRAMLEHVEAVPLPPSDTPPDADTVIDALRHIDPACSRSEWVKVGMALRAWTDDPTLFDQWSSGELSGAETPANYVPEHIEWQWRSFKPTGNTQLGSLFYEAIQGGWRPPSQLDTAAAFGKDATDPGTFNQVVDSIQSHGCDPKQTDALISDIRGACGNALQTATLLALLTRELRDAGLLTKPIRQQLDALAGDTAQPRAAGQYGKNHMENATLFLERCYPTGGLIRSDQVWYAYDTRVWVERTDDDVRSMLTADMADSLPQSSNLAGTYTLLCAVCHRPDRRINEISSSLILFHNGVLDLSTGYLTAHSPDYFTTNILPYNYTPNALAPEWDAFLQETFEADSERIALLQEWFGYMLSNSTIHHKILFMIGPARSGKGVIGRVLEQIVGSYNFSGCGLGQFASDSFLESLRTKTVAFSGDTSKRVSRGIVDLVIEHIKKISGGDALSFSRKYKSNISQTLPTRIVIAANHIPALFDDSGALAGRMLMLPFNICHNDREDHLLSNRLMGELAGIASWALVGLQRLNANMRFTESVSGRAEHEFLSEAYSPLQAFTKDACTFTGYPVHKISCTDLYVIYRAWAVGMQDTILARRTFISAFKDVTRGTGCRYGVFSIGEMSSVRGFSGLMVSSELPVSVGAFTPEVVR